MLLMVEETELSEKVGTGHVVSSRWFVEEGLQSTLRGSVTFSGDVSSTALSKGEMSEEVTDEVTMGVASFPWASSGVSRGGRFSFLLLDSKAALHI